MFTTCFGCFWLTCMSLISTVYHSLLASARSRVMLLFLLNWTCLALDWFDIPCWARCRSCLWKHTCLWLVVAHLYPWMLSLTPPALHSLHSISSGGVSVSRGALGLSLDVCMCQQGGEVSDRTRGKLFDFSKNLFCTGLWECIHVVRVALVRGKCISVGVSALFSSWFSLCFWHDCVEPASVVEESCLRLIDCVESLPLS